MTVWERINQLSIGRAIFIGLVLAGFYYFLSYNNGAMLDAQINANKAKVEELNKTIKDEEAKIERINQYKKTAEQLGESFNRFLSYIPEKLRNTDLMKIVSTEAKAAGANIVRVSEQGMGTRSEFYEEIKVSVELVGTFQQMMLFMSFLTKVDQIITISKLNLRSQSSENFDISSPSLQITADLRGYRYLAEGQKK